MSLIRAMQTGASGIKANGDAISVTSDNITNVNTVGFKKSRAIFEDILGRSVTGGSALPTTGGDVRLGHIKQTWSQGALINTGSSTDLAISGEGFFAVNGNVDGVEGRFYTRAGQFSIGTDGRLTSPQGLHLQGYTADAAGNLLPTIGDIRVPSETLPAVATSKIRLAANLDKREEIPEDWDASDPSSTSNFTTNITVYDSTGAAHDVTVYFRKQSDTQWDWHAMVDGGELTDGDAGVPVEAASGSLTFDTTGALDTETTDSSEWNFKGATPGQAIDFDFGTSVSTDEGTGRDGTTQYATKSSLVSATQDGSTAGAISTISLNSDGTITGVFGNGQRRTLGQVAIADFNSEHGLQRVGQGMWSETPESGRALLGAPGAGGRGAMVSGALEGSNVDLGQEFVDLISYQRGFQASSRIVTTADEMYQELVNLKR